MKFPTHIVQTRAGLAWSDLTVADVKANAPAPAPPAPARDAAVPVAARAVARRPRDEARKVVERRRKAAARQAGGARGSTRLLQFHAKKLADGIYMITGGYRSVAVEMKDHIVLIEAPQSEMTTAKIIAEVKKAIPEQADQIRRQHAHITPTIRADFAQPWRKAPS